MSFLPGIHSVNIETLVVAVINSSYCQVQLSRENFEVFQRYGDAVGPDTRYSAIAVCASPAAPTTFVEKDLKAEQLRRFFGIRPGAGAGAKQSGPEDADAGADADAARAASLKIVIIESRLESWSSDHSSLLIDKNVFLNLVDAMVLDPAALWLIRSEYDGFHYFPGDARMDMDMDKEKKAGLDTYYIGTSNFALVWTFDRRGGGGGSIGGHNTNTRALWILRQNHSFRESVPVIWLTNLLHRHAGHAASPLLLAYVAALSTCCTFDGEIAYRAHVVRLMERETGCSARAHSPGIEARPGMQSLTTYIKDVGEVLNHTANKERQFLIVDSVLDFVVENAVRGGRDGDGEDGSRRLVAAIPALRMRIHASREYLKFLKERAERLSGVLFALLTHEDSATNLELASASRRIAEAAKRDSSSMRAVAVVTMAFLPATFIAALFSVPSLDWRAGANGDDQQPVIGPRFWVYWAFTLPATAVVFALWLLLDGRGACRDGDGDAGVDGDGVGDAGGSDGYGRRGFGERLGTGGDKAG
ncbi:hypothetical protein GGR54DRAFT_636973 [Hypoxylon sp. NC1633]|nr:hypothetical protein GGR54DRAFT_636973 [Hypoxylon sp. NC1633]